VLGCSAPEPATTFEGPPLLAPRHNAVAATIGAGVYVAGGSDVSGAVTDLVEVMLNTQIPDAGWEITAPMPQVSEAMAPRRVLSLACTQRCWPGMPQLPVHTP
jgi:hypothetical protein